MMSGRFRSKQPSVDPSGSSNYSKRCQKDLAKFYNKALKDSDNHFSASFQDTRTARDSPAPSFSVLSPVALIERLTTATTPANKTKKIKKQKSHSYSRIRHKCNEVLHLSIDCHSSEDQDNNSNLSQPEKRVKFKKSHKSVEVPPTNLRKITTTPEFNERPEENDYFNEIFYQKSGEIIDRDVQGFVKLNYSLISKYLTYESSSYKHKLLQALRWRLNLTEKLGIRTIQEFVKYDLLRVKQRSYEKNLMEWLLWPTRNTAHANYIQNSMARLINGIVSFAEGRNYLGSTSVVNYLIWGGENELYKVEPSRQFIDNNTAGMLVAAIMKLSTIPWQRRDMINKNILQWTLGLLEDIEYSGTNFQVKYALGLLNSLIRVSEAVEELTGRAGLTLALLARYLRRDKSDYFFTVKSILVKLFKNKHFRQVAKEMNFETIFRKLINPMDLKSKKEFEFMILYLNDSGNITDLPCSASNFEIEEKIEFDSDIDDLDPIVNMAGLDGELLFEEQFAKFKSKAKNIEFSSDLGFSPRDDKKSAERKSAAELESTVRPQKDPRDDVDSRQLQYLQNQEKCITNCDFSRDLRFYPKDEDNSVKVVPNPQSQVTMHPKMFTKVYQEDPEQLQNLNIEEELRNVVEEITINNYPKAFQSSAKDLISAAEVVLNKTEVALEDTFERLNQLKFEETAANTESAPIILEALNNPSNESISTPVQLLTFPESIQCGSFSSDEDQNGKTTMKEETQTTFFPLKIAKF